MDVKLHLIKGNPKGKVVDVPDGVLKVGRAEDSDLIIASTRISRHHCEITNDGKTLTLRDLGSGNGSRVNGAKVQQQALAAGDEVQLGPLTFVVAIDGVRQRKAAPAPAQPKPAAQAPKPAAKPAPAAQQPKAAPKPAPKPAGRPGPADVLSSLERLAAQKKPPQRKPSQTKGDDVLEISDEDLLDT
jgi:pSer/pThr/pTyr-binding forkhead associated (FHA) protein